MNTVEIQYNYFKDLERLTKTGLYSYFFLLVWLGALVTLGMKNAVSFLSTAQDCEIILVILGSINLFQLTKLLSDKIDWLGEFHTWIDNKLFKFLYRSNQIILRELLTLLDPSERVILDRFTADRRTMIAQSVFSKLADDESIFADLLKRGIFRSWIWYWITMYGISIFSILTTAAAIKMAVAPTVYAQVFFVSLATILVLQLLLGLILGKNLIRVTKTIIHEITDSHKDEIISLLRSEIK